MADAPADCFHCGEPLGRRAPLWTTVRGAAVAVCCAGCRAAAETIAQLGLEDFYRFRTAPASKPTDAAGEWRAYDDPALRDSLTRREADGRSAILWIDGLTCAACGWLITRAVTQMEGVVRADLNMATGRAQIVWDDGKATLGKLLGGIAALGYRPRVVTGGNVDSLAKLERRANLKRLAVAGLGMMQVMMFAIAMYTGDADGMDPSIRAYLRIVSLLVATPVMLYGGWPFLRGAVNSLRMRSVTMDVPVSVGLILAYAASVFNTWRQRGEVYFDSVTMFIFFLTVARYVEMVARHHSTGVTDALSRLIPATAHRLTGGPGAEIIQDVDVRQLGAGDRVLVRAGEVIPADGEILGGGARIDESMLTGESVAVARIAGDRVAAGTLNADTPFTLGVTAAGSSTVLAGIVALLARAQAERPRITRAADRIAGWFLSLVLAAAAAVCGVWLVLDPSKAFPATLAVLVAACPCALSLATLVAVANASTALARRGVLVAHADAIEGLAKVTRVVFDKTGTLTDGRVQIGEFSPSRGASERDAVEIAATLEAASEHPIARAFASAAGAGGVAADAQIVAGSGVEGSVGGRRYRIGTNAFVRAGFGGDLGRAAPGATGARDDVIFLGDTAGFLGGFTLEDSPRPESAGVVRRLMEEGIGVEISSGDSKAAVRRVARHCSIERYAGRQTPMQKLERIRSLAADGEFVAMVGDGINDAPVLGGAGVSVAMGRGSALAHASADLILVGDSLQALPDAFRLARRTMRIIRQNLAWAVAYNATVMPLAAVGWLPPWMAAIGMSASSIVVVLNSTRARPAPE